MTGYPFVCVCSVSTSRTTLMMFGPSSLRLRIEGLSPNVKDATLTYLLEAVVGVHIVSVERAPVDASHGCWCAFPNGRCEVELQATAEYWVALSRLSRAVVDGKNLRVTLVRLREDGCDSDHDDATLRKAAQLQRENERKRAKEKKDALEESRRRAVPQRDESDRARTARTPPRLRRRSPTPVYRQRSPTPQRYYRSPTPESRRGRYGDPRDRYYDRYDGRGSVYDGYTYHRDLRNDGRGRGDYDDRVSRGRGDYDDRVSRGRGDYDDRYATGRGDSRGRDYPGRSGDRRRYSVSPYREYVDTRRPYGRDYAMDRYSVSPTPPRNRRSPNTRFRSPQRSPPRRSPPRNAPRREGDTAPTMELRRRSPSTTSSSPSFTSSSTSTSSSDDTSSTSSDSS